MECEELPDLDDWLLVLDESEDAGAAGAPGTGPFTLLDMGGVEGGGGREGEGESGMPSERAEHAHDSTAHAGSHGGGDQEREDNGAAAARSAHVDPSGCADSMQPDGHQDTDSQYFDDAMIIDDRSYLAPQLQRRIFEELRDYHGASHQGSRLDVFASNLSYSQNRERLLTHLSSDLSELRKKAYIVDPSPGPGQQVQSASPGGDEPSTLNLPTCKSMTILPDVGDDESSRLGYIGSTWKARKGGDWHSANPSEIKVWAFYLLTGHTLEALKKINDTSSKVGTKRSRAKEIDVSLPETALFIVLRADYEPIKLKTALNVLLSTTAVETFIRQQPGPDQDRLRDMLQKLHTHRWADWVFGEDFIRPSLEAIHDFAYKHKHLPGVQTADEIDAGKLNAPEYFKSMLMYVELYLGFLAQHATEIARHESRIRLLEEREAFFLGPFLGMPDREEAKQRHADRIQQRKADLQSEIRGTILLREFQREAVELCLTDNRIINLPTGTGKTIIAVKLIDDFLQRYLLFSTPTHTYRHTDTQTDRQTHTHARAHTHTHTRTYAHAYTHTQSHTHNHTYTIAHTITHTITHTQSHTQHTHNTHTTHTQHTHTHNTLTHTHTH